MKSVLISLFILLLCIKSEANVVGVDAQNFNPTTSGLDFVTVQSSKTLEPGVFNFGMFFNYAVNTLPIYKDPNSNLNVLPQDSLGSMDINMGVGLMNNWDVGVSLPQVVSQSVQASSGAFYGLYQQKGLNEVRVNSKYRLWDGVSQGLAVVGSVNIFTIQDHPLIGKNPGPTYNIELAYDTSISKWTFGANVGYRVRNPGTQIVNIPVAPMPNQVIGSLAASYYFSDYDFKVIAEVFGAVPTKQVAYSTTRDLSSAEALLGGKWDVLHNLAAHFGASTKLFPGTSSPDVRGYVGVNWAFGPLWGSDEPLPVSAYYSPDEESPLDAPPVAEDANKGNLEAKTFTYIDDKNAFTAPPPTAGEETFLARNILFEFNGTSVNPDGFEYLKKFADYAMKGNGFQEMVIIGHTDSVGSDAYNMKLSSVRAQNVKDIVLSYLPPEQREKVKSEGEGERHPIASNRNYQGRALNRRVEFFLKR